MAAINLGDEGSATSTTHAATINSNGGVITTEALTTAGLAAYTMNVTDANMTATSVVAATVALGTSTTGTPVVGTVTPKAGGVDIVIQNVHATAALNGTLKISYAIVG